MEISAIYTHFLSCYGFRVLIAGSDVESSMIDNWSVNVTLFCAIFITLVLFHYSLTMRRNLLNWCNLVSISKKLMFYVFGVVRIY